MWTFEIMPGLPPYGPEALPFSATGQGMHREGLVVRFESDQGSDWTGNFQPGLAGIERVVRHPNGHHFVVVASGQAYVVDPTNPRTWQSFGGMITDVIEVTHLNGIVFGNGLWFEFLGPNGVAWKSRRLSWDGMRDLRIENGKIVGKSWTPDDAWYDFKLSLTDGSAEGGSYPIGLG